MFPQVEHLHVNREEISREHIIPLPCFTVWPSLKLKYSNKPRTRTPFSVSVKARWEYLKIISSLRKFETFGIPIFRLRLLNFFSSLLELRYLIFKAFASIAEQNPELFTEQIVGIVKVFTLVALGKTKRRLHDRETEHFKALTKNDNTSAIADHVKTTGHNMWDHFDILAKGKTDYIIAKSETLFIQEFEPAFNVNVGSQKLMLC